MTQIRTIKLTQTKTGEESEISGVFENTEWKTLCNFRNYAQDLIQTKIVQNGMRSSLKVNFDHNDGLSFRADLPPWEDIIVFLHKFRPLGLNSERTYFFKVCNILSKRLNHPWFNNAINKQRDFFTGKMMQSKIRITSNAVLLNSEKVLNDWLNAYEYHRDETKQQELEQLHKIIPLEISKAIFVHLLIDKAKAAFKIADLIHIMILNKNDTSIQL